MSHGLETSVKPEHRGVSAHAGRREVEHAQRAQVAGAGERHVRLAGLKRPGEGHLHTVQRHALPKTDTLRDTATHCLSWCRKIETETW